MSRARIEGHDFTDRGVLHSLHVYPDHASTGWLVEATHLGTTTIVTLPQEVAVDLANLLLAGPPEQEPILGLYIPGGVNDRGGS